MTTCMEIAVLLAVACAVIDGVLFCVFFSMRSGTKLSQFLRISLPVPETTTF